MHVTQIRPRFGFAPNRHVNGALSGYAHCTVKQRTITSVVLTTLATDQAPVFHQFHWQALRSGITTPALSF